MESILAEEMGHLHPTHGRALRTLIDRWWTQHLPLPSTIRSYLHGDKKNQSGQIRFALPQGPGQGIVLATVSDETLQKALAQYV
ncbi:MAG: hypothetical protein VW420_08995, partial [Schleiferiaceae bacterium]